MKTAQPEKRPVFDRRILQDARCALLKDGKHMNATVWRVRHDYADWVVKDFSRRSWFVRWTVGRLLVGHESRVLRRLAGMDGIPQRVFRIDALAFAMLYFDGWELPSAPCEILGPQALERVEALVRQLHGRGIVHLDLRNTRNMMLGRDGSPFLLDFQSALYIGWLPRRAQDFFKRIDLSGVYKFWLRRFPDSLGNERAGILRWQLRLRNLWPFRSYRPLFYRRKLHPAETALLNTTPPAEKLGGISSSSAIE